MSEVRRIVVATRNRAKLREIRDILAEMPVELVSVEEFELPEVEETGETFEENAAKKAEVDMNVVMTGDGRFIEIQGTGEDRPFTGEEHEALIALALKGGADVTAFQSAALETVGE